MRSRLSSLPIAFVTVVATLQTSLAHASTTLTWEDCIRIASENNPDLKSARSTLSSSEFQIKSAFSAYLPQVSANLGYTRANNASAFSPSNENDSYSATLSVTQNLFNGFADRGRVRQTEAGRDASQANVDINRARASLDLKSAFASMVFASRSIRLSDDIVARRQRNLDLVELRFEGGRENKGSVLLSRAYLAQAQFERTQARNSIGSARAQLARVLNLENYEDLDVSGTLPLNAPPSHVDLRKLASETPEVRQAQAQERQNSAGVEVARGELLPSVDLTASLGKVDEKWFPERDRWSVGLGLTVPLFSGGRNYYGLQSARATLNASSYSREATERQKVLTLQQNYNSYVEAVERENVSKTFLEAARTRSEIARNRYNNGLLSFEEWDVIENDLVTRERAALQSERDRAIAEATWEQSLGQGVIP